MASTDVSEVSRDGLTGKHPYFHIYTVHHTHWDREWWATYQDFRIRLVHLIDDLLETLDRDPEFRTFLLDSQTIVLRDYLEIRPENRARLVQYIRTGRIECGPWYVLSDQFLVSGESHIRNLWLGRRLSQDLDIPILSVGYLPDTFGHIGQMPQILAGFGINNAFMWRGRGGNPETIKNEFWWEAPDGSTVLTYWFPDGYYWMPFFHFGESDWPWKEQVGRVFRSIELWGPRATTDLLLLPYGGDHRPADRQLPARIKEANEAIKDLGEIRWATLHEYLAALHERNPRLQTTRGELRAFGAGHPHILPGVLSARLYLKQANFWGQNWLQRYAEPLSAMAWRGGRRYDAGLLWKAWEYLVQNHPHDSICGCSIDQVHREMLPRFDQSRQIAQILSEEAAQHLNAAIDTGNLDADDRALVVHNPLARPRSGWAAVWIERADVSPGTHQLLDSTGEDVPFQVREVDGVRPMTDRYRWTEIGFVADAIPGMGYRTYRLTPRARPLDPKQVHFTAIQPVAALKGCEMHTDLRAGANILENRYLRVEVDPGNGTLCITDRISGEAFGGLNVFEDGGDAGDEYNYSQPLNDIVLRSIEGARVHVSIAEAGYARATLRVDLDWDLPAGLSADRLSRSSIDHSTRISTRVSLETGSRRVEITTEWENRSRDHRLRALFPLGVEVDVAHAEGQFEVTERPVAVEDPGNGWPELYVPTMPQQGWVSVEDGRRGLMVANRGLPEYEILRDGSGTIALTILRAVGWVSREDLLSRIGGAGPTIPTEDAQCLGRNTASYAIIPHPGSWLASRAYLTAEEYLVPLYGSVTNAHEGVRTCDGGEVELLGDHTLLVSACKKAEERDALILRAWNVARESSSATVRLARRPATVQLVDLREEPLAIGAIPVADDGTFQLVAGPAAIVTVAITFGIEESPT